MQMAKELRVSTSTMYNYSSHQSKPNKTIAKRIRLYAQKERIVMMIEDYLSTLNEEDAIQKLEQEIEKITGQRDK